MVMVLVPTSSGIVATVQLLPPVAAPEPPVEFVQVTDAMPMLSAAVPLTAIELAWVDTVANAGEVMAMEGGELPLTCE